ncbi:hypothetical protein EMCG_07005 [[Emmonsia] crescens]|uniref:Uncharacterized protein n=1 Tax=[Emmonsia] crescens TaxID=73230 RepID=A0A0G2JBE1_9EURO|nr:hypothetical protein EMCG_07005 [Emmonsia crescens UAMH 3008]
MAAVNDISQGRVHGLAPILLVTDDNNGFVRLAEHVQVHWAISERPKIHLVHILQTGNNRALDDGRDDKTIRDAAPANDMRRVCSIKFPIGGHLFVEQSSLSKGSVRVAQWAMKQGLQWIFPILRLETFSQNMALVSCAVKVLSASITKIVFVLAVAGGKNLIQPIFGLPQVVLLVMIVGIAQK